jgi:hypothetical protein
MHLQIIGDSSSIAAVIDEFSHEYHEDFFEARSIACEYLADSHIKEENIRYLACCLRSVLISWGAGKRKAPKVHRDAELTSFLRDSYLHSDLYKLAKTSLTTLNFNQRSRQLSGAEIRTVPEFDSTLLSVLNKLSNGLFIGNTNVTYPMKAVMLLTGLMPAFDSQVRAGLKYVGFEGVHKTQYLLPSDGSTSADAKKLTRFPFILGNCWAEHTDVLNEGAQKSCYPRLVKEPGRLFDILFFMQERDTPQILRFHPAEHRLWYEIQ